jgi:hypothetical protein
MPLVGGGGNQITRHTYSMCFYILGIVNQSIDETSTRMSQAMQLSGACEVHLTLGWAFFLS